MEMHYAKGLTMGLQRFTGSNNREALEKVRASLGPEAFILSNERTVNGIEVTAQLSLGDAGQQSSSNMSKGHDQINEINLGYLDKELKALREVIQASLGERSWRDFAGKTAVRSTLEHRLATLGLNKKSVTAVLDKTNVNGGLDVSWRRAVNTLKSMIPVEPLDQLGARINVVLGGTVACRSLAICQLSQSILAKGKSTQILVVSLSADPAIKLKEFCKTRGVSYVAVNQTGSLREAIEKHGRGKVIFVEASDLSPSLGIKDPALANLRGANMTVTAIMVVPANFDSGYLASLASHLTEFEDVKCVISQIQNAASLGSVLDLLISNCLPVIGFLTQSDQKMPKVTGDWLISVAKRLAREKINKTLSIQHFAQHAG